MANTTGTFTDPVDGTPQSDDTDMGDNVGVVNVNQGVGTYVWTGLTPNTTYYFKIYPYTNSGSLIDYKIDGVVPTDSKTTTNILPEPTNHATAFAVSGVVGSTTATLTWTDAETGDQAPENYVIVVNTTGTFTVTDGTPIADDTDFSDNAGAINVAYGVQTATINTLVPGKDYYAQIFPYTNSGAATDYKTDGTVPQVEILTPSITITYPNGGETYYAGDQITITWTSANMGAETIKLEAYLRNYLSSTWGWQELAPSIPNTGSFAFTIPAEATYGTQYKIRLTGNTSGTSDECDAAFTIIASPRIYSIQSENTSGASNWATDSVRIGGIVTAVTSNAKNYYLQAGTGPWSGIYVFYNATHTYQVGDSLIVKGKVEEFNNLTELTTSKAATVVSSANPVPAPAAVSTSAAKAEEYESVLMKVTGATCASGSAGSYVVNDGSGDLTVYKSIFTGLTLEVGRKYDITGVLGWFNTTSIYQLYPRSAADVYAYSNDATLSTFTLGGQDVLALSGIVVANPATDPGATLHVDNFTGFAGIVAAATSAKATFAITLNGATVDPTSYATQALADGDVVVATVTAEDGIVKHYKVTLSGENRTLTVTAPAGGESYSTGQPVTITWTSTNITSVNISVYDAISHTFLEQLNTTPVDATLGTFTYTIVNGEFGSIILRISDAADPAFYDESAGSFTVTDIAAPAITARFPVNNATDVAQNFTLSITFDEDVDAGTGNLEIKKTADNSVVLTAAASEVTINNSTVTLSVSGLDYSTSYYVTLPAGFVVDQCGTNGNAAIAANEWTFTTME
ncbi:MAG TPA: Ig-like domain-containing protein, partial [Tenuifilaceae bacterium]|nr:Ig-like domain-containing protein [Tenuifilaceae bacterium]